MSDRSSGQRDPHTRFGLKEPGPVETQEVSQPVVGTPSSGGPERQKTASRLSVHTALLAGIALMLLVITLLLAFGNGAGASGLGRSVNQVQWEYLVISPGSISFSLVGTEPPEKFDEVAGLVRLLRYSGGATTYLDVLGLVGWELVAVVGSIGGDQQYVLKRPRESGS